MGELRLGRKLTPIGARRLANFKANRRGYASFVLFVVLFGLSLFAELIANDRPLLVRYEGRFYFPVLVAYPETEFGGFFETEAVYTDPAVKELIEAKGWIVWPPIPYSYDTVVQDLPGPAPSPPTRQNWLGTDDQARDVLARVIYGFRISVLFGLVLTVLSSVVGVRRRGAGLFRRLGRPRHAALHGDLERHAQPLSPHHHVQLHCPRASGPC